MAKNVFDKENVSRVNRDDLPGSYFLFGDDVNTYDISKNREK